MEANDHQPCPSPSPYRSSSSLFRDISNFKTPKRAIHAAPCTPNHHSFAAVKQTPRTPCSSFLRRRPSPARSAAARRLRAVELEQCQSARKAQSKKDLALRSLSKSLSVWLNFLFESPGSCGCDPPAGGDRIGVSGKREGGPGVGIRVDGVWRSPKRQRDVTWSAAGGGGEEVARGFPSSRFSGLRASLSDVCSFDDLTLRLRGYLSLDGCKEAFDAMTHVVKSIDHGRLKMKVHCPIVTDFGMKEKAVRILMCYNPIWLRIGLYIVFGGDSLLLSNEGASSDQEAAFLKLVIEKLFFSHAGLAKEYAYNKMVEGLYRPGYYEALGNIILKRFLLLALILDRAKSYSSLPLTYGIDGIDGGSPLLFTMETKIKSSRQAIHDFLSSDVMHGEGNLLAHLLSLGYKVSYQQCALVEYDFRVRDVFIDLQDGVRISRAIYLLQHDSSILMKLVVPSDTRKKNLANCDVALQYLRKAGVPLQDEDGMDIVGEDVANGDKELVLSLLWNVFVHLQLPLLVNRTILDEEISKIRRIDMEHVNNIVSSPLAMLLNWIQAICETYDFHVEKISALVDGKAIWCLLDYYFRKELHCSCSSKDSNETKGEESIMSVTDYTDAVHNFILSQKLTALLGNFPEVLQISDILENNGASNDKSVVILLVFLASQLVMKKNMDKLNFHKLLGRNCQNSEKKHAILTREDSDGNSTEEAARKFKVIQAWWQDMAESNKCVTAKPTSSLSLSSTNKQSMAIHKENAVIVIQSHARRMGDQKRFLKVMKTVSFMQTLFRAWLAFRLKSKTHAYSIISSELSPTETFRRYVLFFVDRHGFVKLKKSVLLIQQAAKNWIDHKHQKCLGQGRALPCVYRMAQTEKAASKIQIAWKNYTVRKSVCEQNFAATKIQSEIRCRQLRREYIRQKEAIIKIQRNLRSLRCQKAFEEYKIATRSAVIVQSHVRGWIARQRARKRKYHIVVIQRHCRGWLTRRNFLSKRESVITIQSVVRSLNCWKSFYCQRNAAIEIQRFIRGHITRKRLLGASCLRATFPSKCTSEDSSACFQSVELPIVTYSVLKLQRWWKGVLLHRLRARSAVIIQSHLRVWIARRKVARERHHIVAIQSYWKGCLVRKNSREQLIELRLRIQKTARSVDDKMRIINKLLAALAELQSMRSISDVIHTCATLDKATEISQRCCEELVAAGAISTLLEIIATISRSIPDQEVLKHALSTLRNLARYPHLLEELINAPGSVQTILLKLLRNKEEGYFIASQLLKKICSKPEGIQAMRRSPGLLRRLHSLVEELSRKANNEKRNSVRLITEKRYKEAVDIFKMVTEQVKKT